MPNDSITLPPIPASPRPVAFVPDQLSAESSDLASKLGLAGTMLIEVTRRAAHDVENKVEAEQLLRMTAEWCDKLAQSAREARRESVTQMALGGFSNEEIAEMLGLSRERVRDLQRR